MNVISTKLMWAVQAMAQPASLQIKLYPDFVEVADELALEFDEARQNFLSSNESSCLSVVQRKCLDELDGKLEAMSGLHNAKNWTLSALAESEDWDELRELASAVLLVFGWKEEPPPFDRGSIFIN